MGSSVTQLSCYPFTADEALGFHDHVLAETSVLPPEATGKLIENYQTNVDKLKRLMKRNNVNTPAYASVKNTDRRRVSAYSGCVHYLDAMAKSHKPEVSSAARDIKSVFKKFPDIRRVNDNTQTGILDNLIDELAKLDPSTQELTLFTPWFTELKEAQESFVAAVHNKNAVQELKRRAEVRKTKDDCESAYKALINRVNAMAEMSEGDDSFDTTFIKNINVFIEGVKEARDLKAARAACAKKKTELEKDKKTDSKTHEDTNNNKENEKVITTEASAS